MTIIAAASWDGEAWIGSDSAGTDGWGVQRIYGPKLISYPFGIVGFSASYRVPQVLERELRKLDEVEHAGHAEELSEMIRSRLRTAGFPLSGDVPCCPGLLLLIVSRGGSIWQVQTDLSVLRCRDFSAIGSGYEIALGALYLSRETLRSRPKDAVVHSLLAACAINAACSEPIFLQRAGGALEEVEQLGTPVPADADPP